MISILATGIGVIAIMIGGYELLVGHMPGGSRQWLWLRPNSSKLQIRLTASLGVLVGIVLLVFNGPDSILAYGVGLAAAAFSVVLVMSDVRSSR